MKKKCVTLLNKSISIKNIVLLAMKFLLSRKWQYFLVFFGVFIGTALFYMFLSVQFGLEKSLKKTFSTQDNIVSVEKNPQNNILIDDELKIKLEKLSEVEKVYRETALILPFAFDIDLPFSKKFSLDLYFLYGIEDDLFKNIQEFKSREFENSKNPKKNIIPVLINPLSVDIINSFVQSIMNGFSISNNFFTQKYITAEFGKSTFLPSMSRKKRKQEKLFVSGFSSFAPMVGVAIPLSKARDLQNFFGNETTRYSKFHILAKNGISQDQLQKVLENIGLKIKPHNVIANKITEVTNILEIVLISSSSITLLLSFLFLFSVLQVVLIEQKKTIGILQAMGMSKKNVSFIFVLQSGGVAILGIFSGLCFGTLGLYGLSIFWEKYINLFLFPSEIFNFNISIFIAVFIILALILLLVLYFIIQKQMKTTILENILE